MSYLSHLLLLIFIIQQTFTISLSLNPSSITYVPPYKLSNFQQLAFNSIKNNLYKARESKTPYTLLCLAPTGTGKSTIAYSFISTSIQQSSYHGTSGVTVYTAPLKSIVSEKYGTLKNIFPPASVAMVTGDGSINLGSSTEVVVCTTECLRNALYKEGKIGGKKVEGVCIDEFQYLGEGGRGGAIEEVMILSNRDVPMCFLTATMSNHGRVGKWMEHVRGGEVEVVEEKERAVGLRWEWWDGRGGKSVFVDPDAGPGGTNEFGGMVKRGGGKGMGGGKKGFGDKEGRKFRGKSIAPELAAAARKPGRRKQFADLGRIVEYLSGGDKTPGIVFVFSRKGCEDGARDVGSWIDGKGGKGGLLDRGQEEKVMDVIREAAETTGFKLNEQQVKLLLKGVHYHHAGLLPPYRQIVERLFNEKLLPVLFATTTLAAGVNLPCRTAVVMGMRKRGDEGWGEISKTELRQIAGRAGRRGIDTVGHCLIVPGRRDKLDSIKTLLEGQTEEVASCFKVRYGLVMAGVKRRGGMRKLVERNFGTWERRQREEEGGDYKREKEGIIDKVREAQAARVIREALLKDKVVETDVKEVLCADGQAIAKEVRRYTALKRQVEEGKKTLRYLLEQEGDGGDMEGYVGGKIKELEGCFVEKVARSVNDVRSRDEMFRFDMNRLFEQGDLTGDLVKRILDAEMRGAREMERAMKRGLPKIKKDKEGGVWEEYLALISVLERFGCIVDAGVGKDEDGVVIYEETEEGQKVKSISADNPLHIAACLGEVNNGKSSGNRASSTWEEMREELNVAIDQMTDVEFAGYVSCLAEEREEGGLYETESDALNTALQVASEISDGVYNAQLEERVNVKENGCNLDSGNADVVMRWANGEDSWEDVVEISGRMEGDVARVIMRTADMLKQLDNKGWEVAGDARRRIIRGEVEEFYYGV